MGGNRSVEELSWNQLPRVTCSTGSKFINSFMLLSPAQSEVILEYFQDDVPVLFFQLGEDGVVLAVNRYCQELLGTSIVGRSFGELLVDFQQSFRLEEYIHKDSHSLLSLNIPNSLPRSYLFNFRSVNDSILVFAKSDAEELELLRLELLHANQELNNLTRSLHKKNAQLEHLNKIKNQFLGMAAHDLRKPISVIFNYVSFCLMKPKNNSMKNIPAF